MILDNPNGEIFLDDINSSEPIVSTYDGTVQQTSVVDREYDNAMEELAWGKLVELIEKGADYLRCNVEGEYSSCILGESAYFRKNHIVTLVIRKQKERGEYSREFQEQCTYALWVAVNNNDCELVAALLSSGAELIENYLPHTAAESGAWRVLEELKAYSQSLDLNRFDAESNTPLYYASKNGYIHTINWLLTNGADVNLRNSNGNTALHVACKDADEDSVHLLIKRGANINMTNDQGETPVLIAARIGKEGHIIILSSKKANLDKRDNDGNFPLLLACENGHTGVIKELITNGASFRVTSDDWHRCMLRTIQNRRDASAAMCIRLYPSEDFLEEFIENFEIPITDLVKSGMTETVIALLDRMVIVGSDRQKDKLGNYLKGKVLTKYLDLDCTNRMPHQEGYDNNDTYLLQQICCHCSGEIAYHGSIRLLVDKKMKQIGYPVLAVKMLFYIIFLCALAFSLIEASYDANPFDFENLEFPHLSRLVAEAFVIIYFIINVITEGVEFFRVVLFAYHHINHKQKKFRVGGEEDSNAMEHGARWDTGNNILRRINKKVFVRILTGYFSDRSNYWDVTGLLSLFILFILRVSRLPIQWIFACVAYFINSLRIFKLILLIPVLGPYSTIIYKVLRNDVPKFATLFIIILFIFTGTFFISLRVPYSLDGFINESIGENTAREPGMTNEVWWVFLSGLRILVQGNLLEEVKNNYIYDYFNWMSAVVYLTFLFLIIIVYINVFIAQLSDTYSKFEQIAAHSFAWHRLNFIIQLERTSFLSIFQDIRKKYYTESIDIGKDALNEYYKVNDIKLLNVKSFNEHIDVKRMLNTIQTQQKISEKLNSIVEMKHTKEATIWSREMLELIDDRIVRLEQRFDSMGGRMEQILDMLTGITSASEP